MPSPLSHQEENYSDDEEEEEDEEDDEEEDEEEDTDPLLLPSYALPLFSERSLMIDLIASILYHAKIFQFIMQSESLEGIKFRCTNDENDGYTTIHLVAIKYTDEDDFSDVEKHNHLIDEDYLMHRFRTKTICDALKKLRRNSAIKLDYIEFIGTQTILFTLRTNVRVR